MCWFSAEHVNKIEDAKAGQRLGIKRSQCIFLPDVVCRMPSKIAK